jgi:hypothetical protein
VGTRAAGPQSEWMWVRGPLARIRSTFGYASFRPAFALAIDLFERLLLAGSRQAYHALSEWDRR